ncbi:MAG: VCBS repeat-containing protein [Bacteroidota bacterium]
MIKKAILLSSLICLGMATSLNAQSGTDSWTYIEIDSTKQMWGDWAKPEWLRYFGLDADDIDRDGDIDILSGRYLYHNPGDTMESPWERTVLDDNVDGILCFDVDGDPYADLIAMALPDLFWYEALNTEATAFSRKRIGSVPATTHVNSQGFEKAQFIEGGPMEFVIAGNGNIYMVVVADDADEQEWEVKLICENTSDEGIGVGDVDGDGDLDIAAGRRPDGEDEPKLLYWYENPGNIAEAWKPIYVGESRHPIDRIEIADVNGDGKADVVVTEERYPGLEADANLWWYGQQTLENWERNRIATQYSSNNLDITDIDKDGDIDLLTAEHKGEKLELQLWLNDGSGDFSKQVIDTGKENHLGTQWVDIDLDGDLDIIGAGWDQHRYVHLWRNDKNTIAKVRSDVNSQSEISKTARIVFNEVIYEGRPHIRIETATAAYYFDKAGGGFSRIIDSYGSDWVSFKREPWGSYPASAASAFRGLPNLVFKSETDDGAGHPGHDRCVSEVSGSNKIRTTTKSGLWEWEWTFYDDYAIFEILKTEPELGYWFLYEGTPGGVYQPEQSIYGTSSGGFMENTPDYFKGNIDFGQFDWAYFGKKAAANYFYVAQLTNDENMDMMSYLGNTENGALSEDGMTVFGFGREDNAQALLKGLNSFLIGFYEGQVNGKDGHQQVAHHIENSIRTAKDEIKNKP